MINNESIVPNISPHLRTNKTTRNIMLDVIIALTPTFLGTIYFFGIGSLTLVLTAVISCVLSEYLWQKIKGKEVTIGDFSAVVTGLLISFNMPVGTALWTVVLASIFAIIVSKQFFGGIGGNFSNPALIGRAVIMLLWPAQVANFVTTYHSSADAVSSATILNLMKSGKDISQFTKWDMFIGNIPGAIGETSVLLLLIGFIYLVYRKVVSLYVPLVYLITVAIFVFIFGGSGGLFTGDVITHLLSGGLAIGAFYMLTDYASVPPRIRIVLAIIAGVITGGIRLWGIYPEGACFAILITNCLAGLVEKIIKPHVYGVNLKDNKA